MAINEHNQLKLLNMPTLPLGLTEVNLLNNVVSGHEQPLHPSLPKYNNL
jgi:hypothetical protein